MSLAPVIRAARREDTAAVLALWEKARSAHAITADNEAVVVQLLGHDPGALLVAEEGGARAVAPSHRRRGLATRLITTGERRLHALGARRVTALVGIDDERARNLWASAGYAFDAEIGRHVRTL